MRILQKEAKKGSQRWIQKMINDCPALISGRIISQLLPFPYDCIEWLSPLKDDNYSEYMDKKFLNKLGISELKRQLNDFWPKRGPRWDALGRASTSGPYFLIEAKANISELLSNSKAKADLSKDLIHKSLHETMAYLNCKSYVDWTKGFYQYINRIAHLYFLRVINKVDAYLIFIYFINDKTHIQTSIAEWHGAILLQKKLLGLSHHKLQKYILDIFIDTKEIEKI